MDDRTSMHPASVGTSDTHTSATQTPIDKVTMRIMVHNVRGLTQTAPDTQHLIRQYEPDICILTETHITKRKEGRHALHETFGPNYKIWQSRGDTATSSHTGVLVAIRKRHALLGKAFVSETPHALQGRVLTVQMHMPHSMPLGITAVYAPAQQDTASLSARQHMYDHICTRLSQHHAQEHEILHIMAGDWNATTTATDRTSCNEYPGDHLHRSFLQKCNFASLDMSTTRQHTYFHGVTQDSQNPTSRIDDIYAHRDMTNKLAAPFLIPDGGFLSDHRPIFYDMSTHAAKQVVPAAVPPPDRQPQKVLVRPVNKEDRDKFRAATSDPATELGQQIDCLHSRLNAIKSNNWLPYFTSIETEDGKTANRLQTVESQPARQVINELASELDTVLDNCMQIAMATCKTKITNPAEHTSAPECKPNTETNCEPNSRL